MTGKLDHLSHIIGGLQAQLEALHRRMDENRERQDERHQENRDNLEQIVGKIDSLTMDAMQDRAITAQERANTNTMMATAAKDRDEIKETLKDHDERIEKQEAFHARVGAIIAIAAAVVSAAGYLLWQGIVWLFGTVDFKAIFNRIFN